jgi:hypothetical protein
MTGTLETYAKVIGPIKRIGHDLGYAIAVHGSLKRDIDLVAIPWTQGAAKKETLLKAICDDLSGVPSEDGWRKRAHGRWVHIVRIPRHDPDTYLDLSIMELRP